jgi:DNA-binding beta-propeller fold protein YncE
VAYVPLSSAAAGVAVIDVDTLTLIGQIPITGTGRSALFVPSVNLVYAVTYGNATTGKCAIIDPATDTVISEITMQAVQFVAASPAGDRVYVAGEGGSSTGRVFTIDTATNTVIATFIPGSSITTFLQSPADPTRFFMTRGSTFNIFDSVTNSLTATLALPAFVDFNIIPGMDSAGARTYYGTGFTRRFTQVTTAGPTLTTNILFDLPFRPIVSAAQPDNSLVYVGFTDSGGAGARVVRIFDPAMNAFVGTIPTSGTFDHATDRLALNEDGSKLYVASASASASNQVSVVSLASNTIIATLSSPGAASPLIRRPGANQIWFKTPGTLRVINTLTDTFAANIPLTGDSATQNVPFLIAFALSSPPPPPPPPTPPPPVNFLGVQEENDFRVVSEYFNRLTWRSPEGSPVFINHYVLSRDGIEIAILSGDASSYEDHNRNPFVDTTYTIVAVSNDDVPSDPVTTVIPGAKVGE